MSEPLKAQQNLSSISEMPLPVVWIERIFERLHGRLGNTFLSKWQTGQTDNSGLDLGVENAKKTWADELSGYTVDEIKRGLAARYAYPPSCDEFQKKCRPEIDYERAFVEACQQIQKRKAGTDKWTSAFVFWAAVKLGNDLMSLPYQTIKARWQEAFDKAKEGVENGTIPNEIPEKKVSLPSPGKTTVSQEESARRFAEINKILAKKIVK